MTDLPVITTSERSTFKRCPQKWWWKYRDGYVPKGDTVDALWFGIGVHIALAEWYHKGYRRGQHPAKTFAEWAGEEGREIRAQHAEHETEWYDEPKWLDAVELGTDMLEGYVDKYGKDRDWQVIAIEQQFKVRVIRQNEAIAWFMSTFDGVFRSKYDGRVYLMEHKTASHIDLAYLELDDQAGAYWAVATAVLRGMKVLRPDETIAGIEYNFLRKAQHDPREQNEDGLYLNQNGEVSKRQSPARFVRETVERRPSEMQNQMNRLADEVTMMNMIRAGQVPLLKHTQKDCARFCEFFDMCRLHEHGTNNWLELAKALYNQFNPYERYQKSAQE
jgi:hypothetical protein